MLMLVVTVLVEIVLTVDGTAEALIDASLENAPKP